MGGYLIYLLRPLLKPVVVFLVFGISVWAAPGLQILLFETPAYDKLQRVEGEVTLLNPPGFSKPANPIGIKSGGMTLWFTCRISGAFIIPCMEPAKLATFAGKRATVWWHPQPRPFFIQAEKRMFQLYVGEEIVLPYSKLIVEYERQKTATSNLTVTYLTGLALVLYFLIRTILWSRLKKRADEAAPPA